ncbi:hypothetical protein AVEN_58174-1 [Araneus ventricosus]|uniref:Uncharacterized protein n=1 Tax=Araneus ventricosus TaxID=182803 RepID=A0A4Y2QGH6_ARAVE|nr:hypothetical protein AVEN_58174-1 [Araneus ventricosus]
MVIFLVCHTFRSLVILMPRLEATRGLFLDGPRNFEPWSDDEDDASACTPSPNFRATLTGGRLATSDDLACNGGSSVESDFEPGTLLPRSLDLTIRPPRPPYFL